MKLSQSNVKLDTAASGAVGWFTPWRYSCISCRSMHLKDNRCGHCAGLHIHLRLQETIIMCKRFSISAISKSEQQHQNPQSEIKNIMKNEAGLRGLTVAFTTPAHYAPSLRDRLQMEGARPLWCPTIAVECSAETQAELRASIWGPSPNSTTEALQGYRGIAFTSRAGIMAVAEILKCSSYGLGIMCSTFLVGTLGNDIEMLQELGLTRSNARVKIVAPSVASPEALIEAFGDGTGQSLLCPVPLFVGLEEPLVVPNFLKGLRRKGWTPVRVNAYVTKWLGEHCAESLINSSGFIDVDAIIFTSTAEVEGLLKSMRAVGQDIALMKKRCVLAAHGPVTAKGAARLGLDMDVVGEQFQTFQGVVDALLTYFQSTSHSSFKNG